MKIVSFANILRGYAVRITSVTKKDITFSIQIQKDSNLSEMTFDFCTYLLKGAHKPFDPPTLARGLANEEKNSLFAQLVLLCLTFWPQARFHFPQFFGVIVNNLALKIVMFHKERFDL